MRIVIVALIHCTPFVITNIENILVYFLEKHASEVLNMLFTEWNLDDALAVRYEEGREDTLEETAKSMLKEGLDVVLIERITKLPREEILALR